MNVDPTVFDDEFQPDVFLHRNAELDAIASVFDPLTKRDAVRGAFIHGPSGTGKTTGARRLLGQVDDEIPDLTTVYVDAWQAPSRTAVARAILGEAHSIDPRRFHSEGIDDLLRRLRDLDPPVIVVLDEADRLDDRAACRDLVDARHVSPVVVANAYDGFLGPLDERVRSRLARLRDVAFERYTTQQLVAILDRRVEAGVRGFDVSRRTLERVADRAGGNARTAITTLFEALQLAADRSLSRVTDDVLDDAVPRARRSMCEDVLASLPPQQVVFVEVVAEYGPARMGPLYERFCERVDDPKGRRTVTNWAAKLEEYEILQFRGSRNAREYEVTEAVRSVL